MYREFEHCNLSLTDFFWSLLGSQVQAAVHGRLNHDWHFRLLNIRRVLGVEQVEVIVAPRDLGWYNGLSVPVEERLRHKVLVVLSEKESDVPVAMIFPLDLLVQRVLAVQFEFLSPKFVSGNSCV